MIMTNRTGDEKYEILRGEPSVNDIVFKGGHKYKRSVGNIELDGEINQHMNNYTTANHETKGLIIEQIYTKLNDLRKGSKCFECSEGNFNGRYIECRSGKLYLLRDKKHVYSCLRRIFTRLKSRLKKSQADKENNKTGAEQYHNASLEQKRLIWLCQGDLLQVGNCIGGIDQYNKSGTVKEYYTSKIFRKHTEVSIILFVPFI